MMLHQNLYRFFEHWILISPEQSSYIFLADLLVTQIWYYNWVFFESFTNLFIEVINSRRRVTFPGLHPTLWHFKQATFDRSISHYSLWALELTLPARFSIINLEGLPNSNAKLLWPESPFLVLRMALSMLCAILKLLYRNYSLLWFILKGSGF